MEWATIAGPIDNEVLVVWDRARRLRLVDTGDGKLLFDECLDAGPGLRLATGFAAPSQDVEHCSRAVAPGNANRASSRVAYGFRLHCYDIQSLHTIEVTETAAGRRSASITAHIGRAFAPEQYDQDPEYLVKPLVVDTWGDDVLVVRTDGSLVLFDVGAGRVRASRQLSRMGAHMYLRDATRSALLWKHGSSANLLLLDRAGDLTVATPRRLGDTLPIWCELSPAGLIALWLDRYEFWLPTSTQPLRRDLPATPRAASVTLCPSNANDGRVTGVLVFADARGNMYAVDVASGAVMWQHSSTNQTVDVTHTLHAADRYVIDEQRSRAALIDAQKGTTHASIATPDRLLSCRLRDSTLFVLQSAASDGVLLTWWPTQPLPSPTSFDFAAALPRAYRLTRHTRISDVLWTETSLIVVEQTRVSVYKLP